VTYIAEREVGPLFIETEGQGQAEWSIAIDDQTLAEQLSGNTALFLMSAKFELIGAEQSGEVELTIQAAGEYRNRIGGTSVRFVSQPLSMTNNYLPGSRPVFITSWSFADPVAYLMPTPYTNWRLRVTKGQWQKVSAIKMTISGKLLQNSEFLS
jgi:hypothetical protein